VRLFSNRSQMTSKCGKNKKVAHEAIAECVICDLFAEQTHGNMESICFIQLKKKTHTTSAFYFKIFLNYSKAGLCPLWQTRKKKKPFDVICCLYKIKQFHWLLCPNKELLLSRKITPLSNLTQMASRGKNTLGKHAVAVNTARHLIRVLNKRRDTDGGNLCPLW